MVVKWQFEDPVTIDSYVFDINPNEGGSPQYQKNIITRSTSAPNGKVILFEGRDNPRFIEFSGVLLTEDQLNKFVEWWDKRYQINITDDLGRTFTIVMETFTPKRERANHYPYKHTYSVRAIIVDWP